MGGHGSEYVRRTPIGSYEEVLREGVLCACCISVLPPLSRSYGLGCAIMSVSELEFYIYRLNKLNKKIDLAHKVKNKQQKPQWYQRTIEGGYHTCGWNSDIGECFMWMNPLQAKLTKIEGIKYTTFKLCLKCHKTVNNFVNFIKKTTKTFNNLGELSRSYGFGCAMMSVSELEFYIIYRLNKLNKNIDLAHKVKNKQQKPLWYQRTIESNPDNVRHGVRYYDLDLRSDGKSWKDCECFTCLCCSRQMSSERSLQVHQAMEDCRDRCSECPEESKVETAKASRRKFTKNPIKPLNQDETSKQDSSKVNTHEKLNVSKVNGQKSYLTGDKLNHSNNEFNQSDQVGKESHKEKVPISDGNCIDKKYSKASNEVVEENNSDNNKQNNETSGFPRTEDINKKKTTLYDHHTKKNKIEVENSNPANGSKSQKQASAFNFKFDVSGKDGGLKISDQNTQINAHETQFIQNSVPGVNLSENTEKIDLNNVIQKFMNNGNRNNKNDSNQIEKTQYDGDLNETKNKDRDRIVGDTTKTDSKLESYLECIEEHSPLQDAFINNLCELARNHDTERSSASKRRRNSSQSSELTKKKRRIQNTDTGSRQETDSWEENNSTESESTESDTSSTDSSENSETTEESDTKTILIGDSEEELEPVRADSAFTDNTEVTNENVNEAERMSDVVINLCSDDENEPIDLKIIKELQLGKENPTDIDRSEELGEDSDRHQPKVTETKNFSNENNKITAKILNRSKSCGRSTPTPGIAVGRLSIMSSGGTSAVTQSIITRTKDLTIIVPNTKKHRRVKLNRNRVSDSNAQASSTPSGVTNELNLVETKEHTAHNEKSITITNTNGVEILANEKSVQSNLVCASANTATKTSTEKLRIHSDKKKSEITEKTAKEKKRLPKKKKVKHFKESGRDGSDHDEIMLQLSDSEKMDLLEDFDRKHYDNVSSSESDDSSSDSLSEPEASQRPEESSSDSVALQQPSHPPTLPIVPISPGFVHRPYRPRDH